MKKWIVTSLIISMLSVTAWAQTQLTKYEYWIDSDYAGRVQQSFVPSTSFNVDVLADFSSVKEGYHTISVRFLDNNSNWSSVVHQAVYKLPPSQYVKVIGMEYWFDDAYDDRYSQSFTPEEVLETDHLVDASHLSEGLHLIQLRYRDNYDRWGNIIWRFFLKQTVPTEQALITGYRYWLDEDKSTLKTVSLRQPLEAADIQDDIQITDAPEGSHRFYIQFQDTKGEWSAPLGQEFKMVQCHPKKAQTPYGNPTVCAKTKEDYYRTNGATDADDYFWSITPAEAGELFMEKTKVTVKWNPDFSGNVLLHVNGKNTCGLGEKSEALAIDVIEIPEKTGIPIGNDKLCLDPANTTYLAPGIDDPSQQFTWKLIPSNAGIPTSNNLGQNVVVDWKPDFVGEAKLVVAETNLCGDAEFSDSLRVVINPNPEKPVIETFGQTKFCVGGSVELQGPDIPGYQYIWSNGERKQTIIVNESGFYSLVIADENGCASPVSDQVHIAAYSQPVKPTITQEEELLKSSYPSGNQWFFTDEGIIFGETERTIAPSKFGKYTVQITDDQGCKSISDPYNYQGLGIASTQNGKMVMLYPNPNKGQFTVELPEALRTMPQLRVFDMHGKLIETSVNYSARKFSVNMLNSAKGQYIMELVANGEKVSIQFLIN